MNEYIPTQIPADLVNLYNTDIRHLGVIYLQNYRFVAEPGKGDMWDKQQENAAIQEMWDIHNILVQYN